MSTPATAQALINENRRLRADNQALLEANESLQSQLKSGASINESLQISEADKQKLAALAKFEEAHGPLDKAGKALTAAASICESVQVFTKKHGSLKEVDESLRKLAGRMDYIQESIALANRAEGLMERHGSLESIEEALVASRPIVEAYAKASQGTKLKNVCLAHNISESKAVAMMKKGNLTLGQLSDILESMEDDADGQDANECDDDNKDDMNEANLPAIGSVYKKGDELATIITVGDNGVEVDVAGEKRTIGIEDFARDYAISEEMSNEGDDPVNEKDKPPVENEEGQPDLNKVDESLGQRGFTMKSRAETMVTGRNFIESQRPAQSISEGYNAVKDHRQLSRFERMVTGGVGRGKRS